MAVSSSSPALSRLIIRASRPLDHSSPPVFLVPCIWTIRSPPSSSQTSAFSTSTPYCYPRDFNRKRGVSALRRTGVRQPLSVSKEPLPQPVLDPKKRDTVEVDKDHGLWEFFNPDRTALSTPEQDNAHGTTHPLLDAEPTGSKLGSSSSLPQGMINMLTLACMKKVERGPRRNCATNHGRTCTVFGGSASRSATGSRPRVTSGQG